MARPEKLLRILETIDGRGYGAYRDIAGRFDFGEFILFIDHVQADPFAAPSRVRVNLPAGIAALPPELYADAAGRVAVADFLARRAAEALHRHGRGIRGSGSSGLIRIDGPGQEILEHTAVTLRPGGIVDARFFVGLPAKNRRVLARVCRSMIESELVAVLEEALLYRNLDADALAAHVAAYRTQEALRARLPAHGLVAFVGDGARLPRRSGVDDRPLEDDRVVPFRAPPEHRVVLTLDDGRRFAGMGIPAGITLIVGGGFHGKSTLLRAIERGIYNHVPGDGRELVVTDPTAVRVRAEDGRSVAEVDISAFIRNLPCGHDTTAFSTELASGSTSQAAGLLEALAAGARVLVLDEDTSATNFLIRDHRMQRVVPAACEPITPLLDRARELHGRLGVSILLVLGGSGDYFDVADTVIHMNTFRPEDATARAREAAAALPTGRTSEAPPLGADLFPPRRLLPATFADPSALRGEARLKARGTRTILLGKHALDLSALEPLVHPAQVTALAEGLRLARDHFADGHRTVEEVVALVMQRLDEEGLDALTRRPSGGLARFRGLELAAAINRLRSLRIAR
ncbi:MAG: ABC-ATPase domain-containing protein [Planctomycetes bacterium]|nr:ABC-ATPase domain-containing protein [Planctomycetota bacterium]